MEARYDGSELHIFINGTKESESTEATGSLAATNEALWMGYYGSHRLHGYLNDVSIYNRALTDAEITDLVNNNRVGRYEYHHTNALGSNIVLTDDNKNVLVRYEYDVFGAIRSEVGTTNNPANSRSKSMSRMLNSTTSQRGTMTPISGGLRSETPPETASTGTPMRIITRLGLLTRRG